MSVHDELELAEREMQASLESLNRTRNDLITKMLDIQRKYTKKMLLINVPLLIWCLCWYWHGWATNSNLWVLLFNSFLQGGFAIWAGYSIGNAIESWRRCHRVIEQTSLRSHQEVIEA